MHMIDLVSLFSLFFFFNDTATTEIYTLSLHDALPISRVSSGSSIPASRTFSSTPSRTSSTTSKFAFVSATAVSRDRKSTRLNSSHANISYAVFCLKKKKKSLEHTLLHNKLSEHVQILH